VHSPAPQPVKEEHLYGGGGGGWVVGGCVVISVVLVTGRCVVISVVLVTGRCVVISVVLVTGRCVVISVVLVTGGRVVEVEVEVPKHGGNVAVGKLPHACFRGGQTGLPIQGHLAFGSTAGLSSPMATNSSANPFASSVQS